MLTIKNKLKILLFAFVILIGLLFIQYFNSQNETFKVTKYNISTDKPIQDLRILLVSDLHLKEYGKNNSDLLTEMRNLNPDLIAIVGDSVIHSQKEYGEAIYFLNQSAAIAPTYFSLGNHEWSAVYYYKNNSLLNDLRESTAIYLDNEVKTETIGNNSIVICGTYDEPDARYGYSNEVFCQLNEKINDDKFKLVLSHCPLTIANTEITPNADLVLSGHEHGGQIIIPFTKQGLYSKNQGILPRYTMGINEIAGNTVIISTGLSNSYYWIPRINNQPELVVIDVN